MVVRVIQLLNFEGIFGTDSVKEKNQSSQFIKGIFFYEILTLVKSVVVQRVE